MRITLKLVLLTIVSSLVLLVGLQSWTAISKSSDMNMKAEDVAQNWLPSVRALGEVKYAITRSRVNEARMVMATNQSQRSETEALIKMSNGEMSAAKTRYEPLISSPDERSRWQNFMDKWSVYARNQAEVLRLSEAGRAAEALAIFSNVAAFNESLSALDHTINYNNTGSEAATESTRQTYLSARFMMLVVSGVALVFAAVAALIVVFRATRPLQRLSQTMEIIAGGKLEQDIEYTQRRDEIGDMAKALQVFKDNGLRIRTMEAEQRAGDEQRAAQRKADMQALASGFEAAVGEIIETVSSASTELEASAETLTSTAERSQRLTTSVAVASEEASANVQSVASATEELSSSVNEIGRQVQESTIISERAVDQARATNQSVGELAQAASRIGDVVELINNIAGQTNLLALNATIEAARAGDAGRGFAVVASEVKALAEQTAKATGEISEQIANIQNATSQSVGAIRGISDTISRMSEISSTIASAIEEQGAATQEISRNIQQAAQGTMQVSSSVAEVQHGASETGTAASQVLSAAQSLSQDSTRLKQEVGRFLMTVRAA
ncbi:MAG: methyl-accepting chemotaxis protein [Bradyrhizobiaceae bacterium PARB1]|jgi:methyl-accepting chemotaxis protein|nr:MAG: methyl-accepting chemotaxis protein [Bradyrhizobiaceae bacterium PARB1]